MKLSVFVTFIVRKLACLFLDSVQLLDQHQPPMRLATLLVPAPRLDRFTELASCMRHATDVPEITHRHGSVVTIIAIRL